MYKRVERHLCEEANLRVVVMRAMQEEEEEEEEGEVIFPIIINIIMNGLDECIPLTSLAEYSLMRARSSCLL